MTKQLKVQFKAFKEGKLITETLQHEEIIVLCNDKQKEEINALSKYLSHENTLNLIYYRQLESGLYEVEFIVFEPDYLMDISMLAECFRPFGNHPLNYTLSRLRSPENTRHLLLGNTANFFVDELVNQNPVNPVNPVEYKNVLKKLFKTSPLEFTTCEDLNSPDTEKAFFDSCRQQFNQIKYAVENIFPKENIDVNKIILEPSFICSALGLQGRLDMMLQDFSAFVELKSGKGVEDFRTKQFMHSAVNHYVQMILYLAVLNFNLDLNDENVSSYLLYSKYPVLSKEGHSKEQLQKALSLRNAIVALEYSIQKENNTTYTQSILNHIKPKILNTANLSGKFYENYLCPQIDKFRSMIMFLNPLELTYFLRVYTFVVKELWLSKLGEKEFEGAKRASNLWQASTDAKIEAGEIFFDLKIIENKASSNEHSVVLSIPEYENFYLPNFRAGDAVVLYERNNECDSVNNKQVFKGAIELLNNERIQIRIRARQRNLSVLPENSLYAVEHDYMDTVFSGMFSALYYFVQANPERKALLLGQRNPEFDDSKLKTVEHETDDVARAVCKAVAAKDCFLLVGPPGTGKTSLALKKIVESCIENKTGNVLLLAYTNRAVDEICKALYDIDKNFNFIRIGSELNCAPEYREKLLDKSLDCCKRRSDVIEVISGCNVFVGTVASISSRPDLFSLKRFDMAIIDEATQLLEPHLLGILCAKDKSGKNAVSRFVLIGDHKQLPAVILQSKEDSCVTNELLNEAGITDLSNSLFERLYRKYKKDNCVYAYDQLTKQGRMHPVIASFSSHHFYEGKLDCIGLPHQLEEEYAQKRLVFIPSQSTKRDKIDKINHQEAGIVTSIVKDLYDRSMNNGENFCSSHIGIITSYRNQIALIRKMLVETGIRELSEITVDTIERFQGSQKDIIIYSFCVNTTGQLKMLPNIIEESGYIIDRKLNVMLTRARKQLFITGNRELLSLDLIYNKLMKHIEDLATIKSFPD